MASILHRHRDAFKRRIIVDMPLQHHRRYFIAKVFINMVFTNIFVNTPSPLVHKMDT